MRRCYRCGAKKPNDDYLCEKCAKQLDIMFSKIESNESLAELQTKLKENTCKSLDDVEVKE